MLSKLFPWYNKEEEEMKDKRVDAAVERGKKVERQIRVLAESYRATGIILQKTYPKK